MPRRTKAQTAAAEQPTETHTDTPPPPTSPPDGGPGDTEATLLAQDTAPTANRPNVKRASVFSDPQAGVRFYFDYEKHRAEITFDAKPSPEVLTYVKDRGFDWDREGKAWQKPIHFPTREVDRLAAKRTYHVCCEMVRKEKGIEQSSPPLPD